MKKVFEFLFIVVLIIFCIYFIQTRNLNGFRIGYYKNGISNASRDREERYTKEWSYKVESPDFNDYMLYKTIDVKKNTAYKLSCMVKTKDIVPEKENSGIGFNICIKDQLEKSESILGTNDWTNLTFYFNSNDNETIDIAFRLGDNMGNCKGTAWFSDIKIEEGRQKTSRNWNFAVFMINNIEADVNNTHISQKLSISEANTIKNSFSLFTETLEEFSNNNIEVSYDMIYIDEPLKSITYDKDDDDYYISRTDIFGLINSYVYNKSYDHIFVVANLGDIITNQEIDWLGLGGMTYDSIGYSNIRISESLLNLYRASSGNYFEEEVFLHEFLHTLERNSIKKGYTTTALHDYESYGYKNEARYGLRSWYIAYIQNKVENGIREDVYYTQPIAEKNFVISKDVTEEIYNKTQNVVQKVTEKISKVL